MKKLFLAIPIIFLSALFSGCLHGDLEIDMGDGINTKNAVQNQLADMGMSEYPAEYTIVCAYYNTDYYPKKNKDTITGTITVCDNNSGSDTVYTVTYAELEYEEPDSSIFTSNCRRYGFKFTGVSESGDEAEFRYEKLSVTSSMMGYDFVTTYNDTRLETYPGVTNPYGGVDAYYAFLENSFHFMYEDDSLINYYIDIREIGGIVLSTTLVEEKSFVGKNIVFDCHFNRTSSL